MTPSDPYSLPPQDPSLPPGCTIADIDRAAGAGAIGDDVLDWAKDRDDGREHLARVEASGVHTIVRCQACGGDWCCTCHGHGCAKRGVEVLARCLTDDERRARLRRPPIGQVHEILARRNGPHNP